MQSVNIKTDG